MYIISVDLTCIYFKKKFEEVILVFETNYIYNYSNSILIKKQTVLTTNALSV